jgi:hypothetical protein
MASLCAALLASTLAASPARAGLFGSSAGDEEEAEDRAVAREMDRLRREGRLDEDELEDEEREVRRFVRRQRHRARHRKQKPVPLRAYSGAELAENHGFSLVTAGMPGLAAGMGFTVCLNGMALCPCTWALFPFVAVGTVAAPLLGYSASRLLLAGSPVTAESAPNQPHSAVEDRALRMRVVDAAILSLGLLASASAGVATSITVTALLAFLAPRSKGVVAPILLPYATSAPSTRSLTAAEQGCNFLFCGVPMGLAVFVGLGWATAAAQAVVTPVVGTLWQQSQAAEEIP